MGSQTQLSQLLLDRQVLYQFIVIILLIRCDFAAAYYLRVDAYSLQITEGYPITSSEDRPTYFVAVKLSYELF